MGLESMSFNQESSQQLVAYTPVEPFPFTHLIDDARNHAFSFFSLRDLNRMRQTSRKMRVIVDQYSTTLSYNLNAAIKLFNRYVIQPQPTPLTKLNKLKIRIKYLEFLKITFSHREFHATLRKDNGLKKIWVDHLEHIFTQTQKQDEILLSTICEYYLTYATEEELHLFIKERIFSITVCFGEFVGHEIFQVFFESLDAPEKIARVLKIPHILPDLLSALSALIKNSYDWNPIIGNIFLQAYNSFPESDLWKTIMEVNENQLLIYLRGCVVGILIKSLSNVTSKDDSSIDKEVRLLIKKLPRGGPQLQYRILGRMLYYALQTLLSNSNSLTESRLITLIKIWLYPSDLSGTVLMKIILTQISNPQVLESALSFYLQTMRKEISLLITDFDRVLTSSELFSLLENELTQDTYIRACKTLTPFFRYGQLSHFAKCSKVDIEQIFHRNGLSFIECKNLPPFRTFLGCRHLVEILSLITNKDDLINQIKTCAYINFRPVISGIQISDIKICHSLSENETKEAIESLGLSYDFFSTPINISELDKRFQT